MKYVTRENRRIEREEREKRMKIIKEQFQVSIMINQEEKHEKRNVDCNEYDGIVIDCVW